MTCIAGYIQNGVVYLGGDRALSDDNNCSILAHPKVFHRDGIVIGHAGYFDIFQVLEQEFLVPAYLSISSIIDSMQECLKDLRNADRRRGDESEIDSEFLVGFDGRLYYVQGNFVFMEYAYPYYSIGSGGEYALGSLHKSDPNTSPEKTLLDALQASAEFCPTVRGPFDFVNTMDL